jgi:uncharacterized protein YifE (UPF0438 family)
MIEQHKLYLRTPFAFECAVEHIEGAHVELLKRYGCWLAALASGRLNPTTPAQEHFLKVHTGEVGPVSDFERAWFSYRVQCLYEQARKIEQDLRTSTAYSYEAVREAYYKVACLGHPKAIQWFHRFGPSNRRVYSRYSNLGNLEIERNAASNEGGASFRTNPALDHIGNDWSYRFDDMDAEDWEYVFGGPDID